jgi:catechol 2,3-dioxygenase-like lactoylglutathione lyase family enzyme
MIARGFPDERHVTVSISRIACHDGLSGGHGRAMMAAALVNTYLNENVRLPRADNPRPAKSTGAHPMTIVLNHTIVPAKEKHASARFFADMFGLSYDPAGDHGHFAPVRVNDTLTLLFDNADTVKTQHYAFHVSDAEFDAIFHRVKGAGLVYGSAPWSIADGKLNDWGGGRGVYFKDPDGHILELMTVPQ